MTCTEDEKVLLDSVNLLTNKPILYAANMSEDDFKNGIDSNHFLKVVQDIAAAEHAAVLPICAELEAEIAGLDLDEKKLFLADLHLDESGP